MNLLIMFTCYVVLHTYSHSYIYPSIILKQQNHCILFDILRTKKYIFSMKEEPTEEINHLLDAKYGKEIIKNVGPFIE